MTLPGPDTTARSAPPFALEPLDAVQRRVLWLDGGQAHHANPVRPKGSGSNVGGHRASSVSNLSTLYIAHLDPGDQVSVKPHGSPVLHPINYPVGRLDQRYLTELRAFAEFQPHPRRSMDPDWVDFSAGSIGIGATASIWSERAGRYATGRFTPGRSGRHVAVIDDAELDECPAWKALADPLAPLLGAVVWANDLSCRSPDPVVPDVAADRIGTMSAVSRGHTVALRYGRQLPTPIGRAVGEVLHQQVCAVSKEKLRRPLCMAGSALCSALVGPARRLVMTRWVLDNVDDAGVSSALPGLGGHDLGGPWSAFPLGAPDKRIDAAAERIVAVSPDSASSTNLGAVDEQDGCQEDTERDRPVRKRAQGVDPLGREHGGPAHRVRHRRGQPGRATVRARGDPVPVRPATPARRHQLRRLRHPTSSSERYGTAVALATAPTRCSGRTGWPRW